MMTNYYAQPTSIQSLSYGYPAGMGEIPVQADGLGLTPAAEDGVAAVAMVINWGTPWLAGYAARKHGYGWPATVGIFFGSSFAMFVLAFTTGLGALAVPAVAAYYAFED